MSPKLDVLETAFSGQICRLKDLIKDDPQCVSNRDDAGQTALHKASMNGWLDCVHLLLDHAADVNCIDHAGCTALHYAAANGYIAIARFLVHEYDANTSIKSNKGYTPMQMASRRAQRRMVNFLSDLY